MYSSTSMGLIIPLNSVAMGICLSEEGGDMFFPHIQGIPVNSHPAAVVPNGIGSLQQLVGDPFQKSFWLKMLLNDLLHIGCLHLRVEGGFAISGNNLHQGYLVTHPHTTHMFQLHIQSVPVDGILHRIPDLITSAGHTTGTQSDPDLSLYLAAICIFILLFVRSAFLTFKIGTGWMLPWRYSHVRRSPGQSAPPAPGCSIPGS